MYAKKSQVLQNIKSVILAGKPAEQSAEDILKMIELFMEPKLRPLTSNEIEEHELVKQVHHSRKDEVRNYVAGLEYEWKREFVPEDL